MKINAFTLMEVTIAMLVSAICITICYTAYIIITGYYTAFQVKSEDASVAMELKQVLEKDFLRAQVIMKTDTGMAVHLDSAEIIYVFKADRVLREIRSFHTDTFKIASTAPDFSFEQTPVLVPDTIDQVSFKVRLGEKQYAPVLIYKWYSSTNLFR